MLERNNVKFEKLSVVADVDLSLIPQLEKLGNTVTMLQSNIDHDHNSQGHIFKEAFQELNQFFQNWIQDPTKQHAIKLISTLNKDIIKKAKENLK